MCIQDNILIKLMSCGKFHMIANYIQRRHDRTLSNNDNILACLNRLTFIVLIAETYYNLSHWVNL